MPCHSKHLRRAVAAHSLPEEQEQAQHMQPARARTGWRYGSAFLDLACAYLVPQWLSESGVLALWAAEDWLSYSDDLCLLMQLR